MKYNYNVSSEKNTKQSRLARALEIRNMIEYGVYYYAPRELSNISQTLDNIYTNFPDGINLIRESDIILLSDIYTDKKGFVSQYRTVVEFIQWCKRRYITYPTKTTVEHFISQWSTDVDKTKHMYVIYAYFYYLNYKYYYDYNFFMENVSEEYQYNWLSMRDLLLRKKEEKIRLEKEREKLLDMRIKQNQRDMEVCAEFKKELNFDREDSKLNDLIDDFYLEVRSHFHSTPTFKKYTKDILQPSIDSISNKMVITEDSKEYHKAIYHKLDNVVRYIEVKEKFNEI